MKENFINILREATENRTYYKPTNDTVSQTPNQNEINYQYDNNTAANKPNNTTTNPTAKSEPVNVINPIYFNDTPLNNSSDNLKKQKENSQVIPNKNINQIIETSPTSSTNCETILSVWRDLFPTILGGINLLVNYTPESCCNKTYDFNFTNKLTEQQTARLMREIYLRILLSLDTYSLLIRKETSQNTQREIAVLRTQMQVLSAAALNVYQDYTATNVVPLRNSINSCIPQNLKDAYCYLHDEIYYIYFLLSKLIFTLKTNSSFYNQLLTILNNLKYQLYILNNFYNKLN